MAKIDGSRIVARFVITIFIVLMGIIAVLEFLAVYNPGISGGAIHEIMTLGNAIWWTASAILALSIVVILRRSDTKRDPLIFLAFSTSMAILSMMGTLKSTPNFFSLFMNAVFFGLVFVLAIYQFGLSCKKKEI